MICRGHFQTVNLADKPAVRPDSLSALGIHSEVRKEHRAVLRAMEARKNFMLPKKMAK